MRLDQLNIMQQTPVFGGVREDVLEQLLSLARSSYIPKGEFFFHENDPADSMFILEQGNVAILKDWQDRQYLLRHLGDGDCFGEMALLDLCPRSASVLATQDCNAIELTTSSLYEIYKHDMEQFVIIQMNLGREISRRLREADQLLFKAKVEAVFENGDYLFRSI